MSGMNGIWGNMNTNNVSYLFGSSTRTNTAGGNMLGIDLAEYSSITRGSYSKLIKAYYAKYGNTKKATQDLASHNDTTDQRMNIKSYAEDLNKAANTLMQKGKDSVFNKVETKDETTGVTGKEYDTDKIYKAVNGLVESYNKYIKKAGNSTDNSVLRQAVNMVQNTSVNSRLLGKIGIKVGADNTLSIDEETFKKADMSTVQSLFSGKDSYGGQIQAAASKTYQSVNNSFGNQNSYTAAGTLGNYSTGNILDRLL